ncbi:MAG TPA: helix-hairpin-helix domain-containing protein [Geobacteraceae bacterium]|nr:helix-hairpin-helix domain-containing protein [Geobacteraceae bacterium]
MAPTLPTFPTTPTLITLPTTPTTPTLTNFPFDTTEPKVQVTLPVGRHTLQLIVEDSAGLRSEPATVVIEVKQFTPTIITPTITHITPTITQITPTLTQITPTLTQITPTLTQITPTITHITPTITQITPTLTQITPTLTHTLPTYTLPTVPTILPTMMATLLKPEPSLIAKGKKTAGKTSLNKVKGVTAEAAGKLRTAGIADAEALARATADKVASALGVDNTKAKALISEAKNTVKK